jgi:hypothetical protein
MSMMRRMMGRMGMMGTVAVQSALTMSIPCPGQIGQSFRPYLGKSSALPGHGILIEMVMK